MRPRGRRRPYTKAERARLPCSRCGGRPSAHQWQCCANGNRWLPICRPCDIALNRMVLRWFGFPDAAELIDRYKRLK